MRSHELVLPQSLLHVDPDHPFLRARDTARVLSRVGVVVVSLFWSAEELGWTWNPGAVYWDPLGLLWSALLDVHGSVLRFLSKHACLLIVI